VTDEAEVVIIGGGVAGASIAYHLTEMGVQGVVLLEKNELSDGTTWHSAGLVGQLRPTETLTKMNMRSVELYRRLRDETGVDPLWKEVGSLRLVSSRERMEELTRLVGRARTFGLPLELIGVDEALDLFPPFDPDGVLGAAFDPTDGYIDPGALTMALVEGARARGALVHTNACVIALEVEGERVTRVITKENSWRARVVVNAAGIWAPEIGRLAGVDVPLVAFQHQYVRVRPPEPVSAMLPTMRDPDDLVYFRPDHNGDLITGGYGRHPAPWALHGVSKSFGRELLDPDWDGFTPLFQSACRRVPVLESGEVLELRNGPESFTPDGEFILGETDVRGFFVAAGFNAHGIAGAGGMGRIVAEWITNGRPSLDVWAMDIRRFGRPYASRKLTLARSREALASYYDIHFPHEENESGRPLRVSPAYGRLQALGAEFGEKAGWERPNFFRCNENRLLEHLRPRGWAGRLWSSAIPAEHIAVRERAGLFDQTSFAKLEIEGPGACDLLQRLCDNNVDRPPGTVVYTQMLNPRGGIECDFTVTRLGPDLFRIVTGTAFGTHDGDWIRKQMPDDGSVRIRDVTSSLACIGLQGPKARTILSLVTEDDVSNDGFPYMRARDITVGDVPCLALRVTYVGELGWELYPPTEYGMRLWAVLMDAGAAEGLVPAGYRAIESLRLEAGFLAWGADITPETNPLEAGLGFAVKMNKDVSFVGKDALQEVRAEGPARKLCCLVLDTGTVAALGNEPVRTSDGEVVGRVTSGGLGYWLRKSIAYAYLPDSLSEAGTKLSLEVFGEEIAAETVRMPLWDPKHERVKS
jgi:glycine cleavage system T protein